MSEAEVVQKVFAEMLQAATGDGAAKRASGEKPPWWRDETHEAALFSHLNRWKHGELHDPSSKAHPLVHLAWRALAIAWQETAGRVNPVGLAETRVPPHLDMCCCVVRGEDGWLRGCKEKRMAGSLLCERCWKESGR